MKDEYVYPRAQGQAPGMEMRDWFAGMAMQGLLAKYGTDIPVVEISVAAFVLADGMQTIREMSFEQICDLAEKGFNEEQD